jgi:hypothetical protein
MSFKAHRPAGGNARRDARRIHSPDDAWRECSGLAAGEDPMRVARSAVAACPRCG